VHAVGRRRIHRAHWFHPRPALVTPPARSLAPIRTIPERRHLLGRLLNCTPGHASRIRTPTSTTTTPHPSLCGLRQSCACCVLAATLSQRVGHLQRCGTFLAASRPTHKHWVTNPPYDSRSDKGNAADRLPCPSWPGMAATTTAQGRSLKDTTLPEARAFFDHMSPRPSGLRQ
jgi:hypothetical protein